MFGQESLSLPFAKQTAYRKEIDVGLVSQFFVPRIDFDTSFNSLANTACEVRQDVSHTLRGGIVDPRQVDITVKEEILKHDQQEIIDQARIALD